MISSWKLLQICSADDIEHVPSKMWRESLFKVINTLWKKEDISVFEDIPLIPIAENKLISASYAKYTKIFELFLTINRKNIIIKQKDASKEIRFILMKYFNGLCIENEDFVPSKLLQLLDVKKTKNTFNKEEDKIVTIIKNFCKNKHISIATAMNELMAQSFNDFNILRKYLLTVDGLLQDEWKDVLLLKSEDGYLSLSQAIIPPSNFPINKLKGTSLDKKLLDLESSNSKIVKQYAKSVEMLEFFTIYLIPILHELSDIQYEGIMDCIF
jgi:hypothetical protein